MTITNTTAQGERGWTRGRNPRAIESQEKMGQQELVTDSALPTQGLDGLPLTEWGVEVVGVRANDPLFTEVKLPAGWMLRATVHDMWSELIDGHGVKRASIFYKAAYYDRGAFIREDK